MARPPIGCMTCIGAEEMPFWTKDQNGARWIAGPYDGKWSATSDQYSNLASPAAAVMASDESQLRLEIYKYAEKNVGKTLAAPTGPSYAEGAFKPLMEGPNAPGATSDYLKTGALVAVAGLLLFATLKVK